MGEIGVGCCVGAQHHTTHTPSPVGEVSEIVLGYLRGCGNLNLGQGLWPVITLGRYWRYQTLSHILHLLVMLLQFLSLGSHFDSTILLDILSLTVVVAEKILSLCVLITLGNG